MAVSRPVVMTGDRPPYAAISLDKQQPGLRAVASHDGGGLSLKWLARSTRLIISAAAWIVRR